MKEHLGKESERVCVWCISFTHMYCWQKRASCKPKGTLHCCERLYCRSYKYSIKNYLGKSPSAVPHSSETGQDECGRVICPPRPRRVGPLRSLRLSARGLVLRLWVRKCVFLSFGRVNFFLLFLVSPLFQLHVSLPGMFLENFWQVKSYQSIVHYNISRCEASRNFYPLSTLITSVSIRLSWNTQFKPHFLQSLSLWLLQVYLSTAVLTRRKILEGWGGVFAS